MPYMAQQQSLYGAPGAPTPPRQPIDIAGAIDALTGGATSLIHGALLRKQAENEMALRTAEANRANAQVGIEQQREAREAEAQRQQHELNVTSERHRFIEAGGVPAHTDVGTAGTQTPITPIQPQTPAAPAANPSPIASAMTSGMPGLAAPIPSTPAPINSSATVYHNEATTTPESYDPTRSAPYLRGVAMTQLRNEGWMDRDSARLAVQGENQKAHDDRIAAMRTSAQAAAAAMAKIKASASSTKSGVAKAMTGNQMEKAREQAAEGLISQTNGSYDDAKNFLDNTAEGKSLRDLGVEPRHLMFAQSQFTKGATGQAIRLQSGALGMEPGEAVGAVNTTRQLVTGGAKKPATKTGDTSGNIDLGKTPAAKPAPAAASPNTPAPKTPAPGGDDFTDDEIAEALAHGKAKKDDVASYIKQQRIKKRTKVGA